MYRQERLKGVTLRIKVLRLFGYKGDQTVGMVTLRLVDTISNRVVTQAITTVSLDGHFGQILDFMIPINELTEQHAIQVVFNDKIVDEISLLDPLDKRYLRRGVVKVQIDGPPPSHEIAQYDTHVIQPVQSGTWSTVEWLDRLLFEKIAQVQLQEAMEMKQLFLLMEMPRWEGRVRMVDDLQLLANQPSIDPLNMPSITPSPHLPPPSPQEHSIIKPSPRSMPVVMKLAREACSCPSILPTFAPGMLWKYRQWVTTVNRHARLGLLFVKSVDWLDGEEVKMAKECIRNFRPSDSFSFTISCLSLLSLYPHLGCFDEQLCEIMKTLDLSFDDLIVYTMCIFVKNTPSATQHFPRTFTLIIEHLKKATGKSLYAAMAVYWLLEQEDWIVEWTWREMMGKQRMLIDNIQSLIDLVRSDQDIGRMVKKERLTNLLQDPPDRCPPLLVPFLSVALPTEPDVKISGVIPEHTAVYKSTQMPVKVSFLSDPDCQAHSVIVKTGEAVDGDLMVMQLIKIINQLWLHEGLDLHIQTYSILPIPHQQGGWLQYVPSASLSAILRDHGNSLRPFLLTAENAERYICSCAGYCVITFLLGVGDRHLENLLLTSEGRLFHVDYAFLFGADPKPFPPPMKLCREMVEAMGGGVGSVEYRRFKRLCLQAYQIVRRNGGIILDFLAVHGNAMVGEAELTFVRGRLALDRNDQQALEDMDRLIDESVHAMFPQVMEAIHKWAQYWRA